MEDLFEGTPAKKPAKAPKTKKAAPVEEAAPDFNEAVAEVRASMPEPKAEKISAATPTRARARRKVVIFIEHEQGFPNYKYVGINGVGYQIKRGEEVVVPESVVNVLSNAKATRIVQNPDGSRTMQEYLATPFRVLRYIEG